MQISKNYDLVWQHSEYQEYQWTQDGTCVNVKRGKIIKCAVVGSTQGYCLRGRFFSKSQIRKKLLKLQKNNCPF